MNGLFIIRQDCLHLFYIFWGVKYRFKRVIGVHVENLIGDNVSSCTSNLNLVHFQYSFCKQLLKIYMFNVDFSCSGPKFEKIAHATLRLKDVCDSFGIFDLTLCSSSTGELGPDSI